MTQFTQKVGQDKLKMLQEKCPFKNIEFGSPYASENLAVFIEGVRDFIDAYQIEE